MYPNDAERNSTHTGGGNRPVRYAKHGIEAEDQHHASRTADVQAAFFLPHLRPGMKLLDCGCGPGSITLGLAEHVAPGEVTGVDMDERILARAQKSAAEKGIDNVRFEMGNIDELPFAGDTFDAVFSNAVLEHLNEPVAALREMHRVLRPGGVVGVRSPDFDGVLITPYVPSVEEWYEIVVDQVAQSGGDMNRAKMLRRYLREAGFVNSQMTATHDVYATQKSARMWAEQLTGPSSLTRDWQEQGIIDEAAVERFVTGWRKWASDPDAFQAIPWVEAVGWKAGLTGR